MTKKILKLQPNTKMEFFDFQALPIYRDDKRGMLTPAALVDINNDSVADIVIATFNRYWLIIFV